MATADPVRKYAQGTKVDAGKTRLEIERVIKRFGASDFANGSRDGQAFVMFTVGQRTMKFIVPTPHVIVKGYPSSTYQSRLQAQLDAEERRLWRSLAMAIKSKLDIVESGISTIETELLPYTVMRDGRTVAEAAQDPEQFAQLIGSSIIALPGARSK